MSKVSTTKSSAPRRGERRAYDSPLRKAQFDETRTRILEAGSELAHRLSDWDWRKLTARGVAERAKVSERTVYRHFATERELQEAILRRLEEEAGISYEELRADELLQATASIFSSLPKFAATSSVAGRSVSASALRRQTALLRVVDELNGELSETERQMVAAIVDVLWTPTFYEHLIAQWRLDSPAITRAASWALDVLARAVRDGSRPGPLAPGKSRSARAVTKKQQLPRK